MKLKTLAFSILLGATALASADTLYATLTFSGDLESMDGYGDSDNIVANFDLGSTFANHANFVLTGIGWDVHLYADSPSWLSEITVEIADSTAWNDWLWLTPGAGSANNHGGYGDYSSGGLVNLTGGNEVVFNPDNIMRLEFFERFDDYADDWDGYWLAGSTIDMRFEADLVPEPASMAVLGLGALALIRRRK